MTITTNPARDEYTSAAGQTVFNYTFKIYQSDELDVYVTPAGQEADDSTDLTTDYVVDPNTIGDDTGGFITFNNPLNAGDKVTIVSAIPYDRTVDYQNNGDFRPDTVNGDNDRQVSQIKQVLELARKAVVFGQAQQSTSGLTSEAPEAGKFIRWKADLSGFENVTLADVDGVIAVDDLSYTFDTVADMVGRSDLFVGQAVAFKEYATGRGGESGNVGVIVAAGTGTPDGGKYIDITGSSLQFLGLFPNGLNVKQFGAGNGSDDTTAFVNAAALVDHPFIPEGAYIVNDDIENTFIADGNVDISGTGSVRIKTLSEIYFEPKEANEKVTLSRLAGQNDSIQFPNKYYPTSAWFELLRLSPNVTVFERSSDGDPNHMTELYVREIVRDMAFGGVRNIILPYVEYFAFWFYEPSFPYPQDYDTNQVGDYWKDQLAAFPNVENFNPVQVILDEANKQEMNVYLGLGRNGDTPLFSDLVLYTDGVSGNPGGGADPVRYGLTLTQRLNNAQNRTREVAADLISQFGDMDSFAGFYISHEPDEFEFSNQYTTNVNTVSGTDPSVRSYGKPIIIGPPSPTDLAVSSTFAQRLIDSGCDIFAAQDSVGPGFDLVNSRNTWVPALTLGQLNDHYQTWRGAIDIANASANLSTRQIRLWANTESWQMGDVIAASVTLSAVSGAAVTATASAASFVAGDVGKFLTSTDGGRAKVTGFTSSTVITVDTTYTGEATIADGTAFGGTSQAAANTALSDGYQNDYPAPWSRVLDQIEKVFPWVDAIALYAWFGFYDSGNASLRPAQTNSDRTDFRTDALAIYSGHTAFVAGQQLKYENEPGESLVQKRLFSIGAQAGATSGTFDFANFYPKSSQSRLIVKYYLRGFGDFGTDTYTFNARVNGINIKSASVVSTDYGGAPNPFVLELTPQGLLQTLGMSFSAASINYNVQGIDIEVEEYL